MSRFHAVLAVAWLGLAVLAVGTCARRAHAGTLRASSTTFWPVTRFSVSGIPVTGTPLQTLQPDGTVLISQSVPALLLPAAVSLVVTAGDGRTISAVLPDGRPGPLVAYPANGCRADLNADGGVGLSDVSMVFGLAASGASCP